MIKLENYEVLGWEHAIRGMRNPKNSWAKSDSHYAESFNICYDYAQKFECPGYIIGHNDQDLMMKLAKGGPVHAKYRRMIIVYADITAPLYWWKEFDTYKVGTVANSCSTMHKIHEKEFVPTDFSCERLNERSWPVFKATINELNYNREKFIETKEKIYWEQMIQLLPSSYNQKRTIMMNYEVLANIYESRRHHKLDEWHVLCDWIESLPCSEIITVKKEKENDAR